MRTIRTVPKEKVENIPLSQISNRFDVRLSLDDDRVIQFAGLYEGGVNLPPIRVVKLDEDEYAYIDGRHRGAARAYLNLPDVPAIICNGSLRQNPVELFAEALEANWGGAKGPTRGDLIHTVTRMFEHGATIKSIRERLNFLPSGALRAYIATARSAMTKRRIAKALDAIAEGATPASAAELTGVKLDNLKEIIAGKKGKWGKNRSDEQATAVELKSYISRALFSANAGIGKKVEGLLKQVDDGEVSATLAASVLKAWADHNRKSAVRIEDWKARLEAISQAQDNAIRTATA
jgi:ParB-like nuclease domain